MSWAELSWLGPSVRHWGADEQQLPVSVSTDDVDQLEVLQTMFPQSESLEHFVGLWMFSPATVAPCCPGGIVQITMRRLWMWFNTLWIKVDWVIDWLIHAVGWGQRVPAAVGGVSCSADRCQVGSAWQRRDVLTANSFPTLTEALPAVLCCVLQCVFVFVFEIQPRFDRISVGAVQRWGEVNTWLRWPAALGSKQFLPSRLFCCLKLTNDSLICVLLIF